MKKDEPGILSTGRRILDALAQDTGNRQFIKLEDEGFKLAGGSAVTVDVPGSFAYKISEFKNTFKDATEGFYSTKINNNVAQHNWFVNITNRMKSL